MNKENINKLKKYIFFISLFFCLTLWSHLFYLYLYNDAKETPLEWWSVSEAIIWDFPNLNPLLNNSDYNKNIIYNLYRWILKYDEKEKKFVQDLWKCNTSDLSNIECFINLEAKWSNWENITNQDVIHTFKIIQNSDVNTILKSYLKNTEIYEKSWAIVFKSKNRNINILPILTQSIVNKNYLDSIWIKELYSKFNPIWWVFSWPYMVDNISYDDALWIQKLILVKNPYYNEEKIYISKYVYKFFKDISHFSKHKDSVNIFNDTTKKYSDISSRFQNFPYNLNQFVWLFVNEENIKNKEIREFILSKIDSSKIINELKLDVQDVNNIFQTDKKQIYKNIALEKELEKIWYFKKDILQKKLLEEKINKEKSKKTVWNIQNLKYIFSPISKNYEFLSDKEIILKWKTQDKNPDNVYINWYKLSSYKKWQKDFIYKLSQNFKNIKTWENKYIVEFETWKKKEKVEEFTIFYNTDKNILSKEKDKFYKEIEEVNKKSIQEITLDETTINKLNSLEESYFYNKDFKKYSLKINYIWEQQVFEDIANKIKESLNSNWIDIVLKNMKIWDLNNMILENKKDYDMILVWIDLWYFDYNLNSYFNSNQTENWFNFSNTKIKDIDNLLEKISSKVYNKNNIDKDINKLIALIEERFVIKTIYQNKKIVYIDKNIKNIDILNKISSDIHIQNQIRKRYVTTLKEINYSNKSISWFYNFLISNLKNAK